MQALHDQNSGKMSQQTNVDSEKEFGPIRSCLWPIYRHETRKLVPMFLMVFLLCFSYSILRNMKDTIVVTASGAEVIPFIKVWVMLPMAILLTILFKGCEDNRLGNKQFSKPLKVFLLFPDIGASPLLRFALN